MTRWTVTLEHREHHDTVVDVPMDDAVGALADFAHVVTPDLWHDAPRAHAKTRCGHRRAAHVERRSSLRAARSTSAR
jgi:hypothetical protein